MQIAYKSLRIDVETWRLLRHQATDRGVTVLAWVGQLARSQSAAAVPRSVQAALEAERQAVALKGDPPAARVVVPRAEPHTIVEGPAGLPTPENDPAGRMRAPSLPVRTWTPIPKSVSARRKGAGVQTADTPEEVRKRLAELAGEK